MKLYPPHLEGTLPSFYKTQGKGFILTIPFSMNKAVSFSEVYGYSLIIKDVINNNEILTKRTLTRALEEEVSFSLNAVESSKFTIGSYYKIQLAYIDKDDNEGYYSTVGVAKCTSQPVVKIEDLDLENNNTHKYTYIGYYNNINDPTEKVYNYQFILTDKKGNIISDSGKQIHQYQDNAENTYESIDIYNFLSDLELDTIYLLQYIITTNNNLVVKSPKYRILQRSMSKMKENVKLETELDFDEGYINISVVYDENNDILYQLDTSNQYIDFIDYYEKKFIEIDITENDYKPNYFYYFYKNKYILSTSDVFDDTQTYYESYYKLININKNSYKSDTYYIKKEHFVKGNFLISRSCKDSGYKEWQELATIKIDGYGKTYFTFKDYTIEQGKYYKYSLQQYNNYGTLSARKITQEIFGDFEDMYLYDGKRQLKIRYNPKVSSFKIDTLVSKTDTIGGKYPYIFQNGYTYYREFPLSGLISYKMDKAESFMLTEELGFSIDYDKLERKSTYEINALKEQILNNIYIINDNNRLLEREYQYYSTNKIIQRLKKDNEKRYAENNELKEILKKRKSVENIFKRKEYKTTNLESVNIAAERIFKTEVLEWLNDGQPKLFRSPGEGNFIIILMNVSFSPEDALGRMLHNFSATAYEIADFNYTNLISLKLLEKKDINYNFLLWKTINLSNLETIDNIDNNYFIDENNKSVKYFVNKVEYNHTNLLEGNTAFSLYFTGLKPNSTILIDGEKVIVGVTGNYYTESSQGFTSVLVPENFSYQGNLTYNYYGVPETSFDLLINETITDHSGIQFIGKNNNLLEEINNEVSSIKNFGYLQFMPRDIIEVELALENDWDNKYYLDESMTTEVIFLKNENEEEYEPKEEDLKELEITYIYKLIIPATKPSYEPVFFTEEEITSLLTMKGYYKIINGAYLQIVTDEPYDSNEVYYTLDYKNFVAQDVSNFYKKIGNNYIKVGAEEKQDPKLDYYERIEITSFDEAEIDQNGNDNLILKPIDYGVNEEDIYPEYNIYYYKNSNGNFSSVKSENELEEGITYYKNNRYSINPFQIGNKDNINSYYCIYREGFYSLGNSKKVNIYNNYYPLYKYETDRFIYQNKIYSILENGIRINIPVYKDIYSNKYYIDNETKEQISNELFEDLINNYNFELLNFDVVIDDNNIEIGPTIIHQTVGKKFNLYEEIDIKDNDEFISISNERRLYRKELSYTTPSVSKYNKNYEPITLNESNYQPAKYYFYDSLNDEYYLDDLEVYQSNKQYFKQYFTYYVYAGAFDNKVTYYYYQDFSKFKFFTNAKCSDIVPVNNITENNCENYYIIDKIKSIFDYNINHAKIMKDNFIFNNLNVGNGVVLNCAYQTRDYIYALEKFQKLDNEYYDGKLQYIKSEMDYYKKIYEQKDNLDFVYNFQNIALTDLDNIIEYYKNNILNEVLNKDNSSEETKDLINKYSDFLKIYNSYLAGDITTLTEFKEALDYNEDLLKNIDSLIQEKLILKDYAKKKYLEFYNKYIERIGQLLTIYRNEEV